VGADVRDAETAPLQIPEDAVKRTIVDLSLEPSDGLVELLGSRRHRTRCCADVVLHVTLLWISSLWLGVSHSAAIAGPKRREGFASLAEQTTRRPVRARAVFGAKMLSSAGSFERRTHRLDS
jgi:hypothetical protein